MPARLHLVCGLPGSGKSERARALEESGAGHRFTPDEWLLALGLDLHDAGARDRVEQRQWEHARKLLARGTSVILENGFWSRAERERYRAEARQLGAGSELHYLAVPLVELARRISLRNATAPANAVIDPALLVAWAEQFDPPGEDELLGYTAPSE